MARGMWIGLLLCGACGAPSVAPQRADRPAPSASAPAPTPAPATAPDPTPAPVAAPIPVVRDLVAERLAALDAAFRSGAVGEALRDAVAAACAVEREAVAHELIRRIRAMPDPVEQRSLVATLAWFAGPECVEICREVLAPDWAGPTAVRAEAAEVLSRIDDPRAAGALLDYVERLLPGLGWGWDGENNVPECYVMHAARVGGVEDYQRLKQWAGAPSAHVLKHVIREACWAKEVGFPPDWHPNRDRGFG